MQNTFPCGHTFAVRDCGGCDPSAIDFEIDETELAAAVDVLANAQAQATWTALGKCRNCHERIESDGVFYRHAHADHDTYCGTGDGAVATPANALDLPCAACNAEAGEPCRFPCTAHAQALEEMSRA